MSLYGDLPKAKTGAAEAAATTPSAWVGLNRLQPPKKPSAPAPAFAPPPSVLRAAAGAQAPVLAGRGVAGRGGSAGRGSGPGRGSGSLDSSSEPLLGASSAPSSSAAGTSLGAAFGGPAIQDEYDPVRPNDYEQVREARERAKREAQAEADRLAVVREAEEDARRRAQQEEDARLAAAASAAAAAAFKAKQMAAMAGAAAGSSAGSSGGLGLGLGSGAAASTSSSSSAFDAMMATASAAAAGVGLGSAAPSPAASTESTSGGGGGGSGPTTVMSMEEYEARRAAMGMTGADAFARRGRRGPPGAAGPPPPSESPQGPLGGGGTLGGGGSKTGFEDASGSVPGTAGMSLAQRMLEKMGWREGEGLGRNRQGIATPLVAQKTAKNAGIITTAAPNPRFASEPDAKRPRTGAALVGKPGRVLCMRNMVGPGEVDAELEEEVAMELTKYGNVTDVVIFEVTAPGYPEEETVRIFVQFDRVESATKAQIDLQGRFFGGRNVRVAFFPEDRFEREDLAPQAGEFD